MDKIAQAYKRMLIEMVHPKMNSRGVNVSIFDPHRPTSPETWSDSSKIATTTPEHTSPDSPKFQSSKPDWNDSKLHGDFEEPPVNNPSGKPLATGAIVHEDDGRVWVIHPTNQFGGYSATFPKGKVDSGISPRANAIKEVHEESGLHIALTGHATDVERSTSYTRYYHAKRIGGHPKDMGWESQAVSLVPKDKLHTVVDHPNDVKLVQAAKSHP